MKQRKTTLYNIPVNKELIWDYEWKEEEYKTEEFFIWYLSRVIEVGDYSIMKHIDFKIIAEWFPKLNLSQKKKRRWEVILSALKEHGII